MKKLIQLVFFVPQTYTEKVLYSIGTIGAGKIGDYSHCSFSTSGLARFIPGESTNPFAGNKGELNKVIEDRVEILCERVKAKKIINEIKRIHPYEEVGFGIYPVLSEDDL